jgi:hypothetical protein
MKEVKQLILDARIELIKSDKEHPDFVDEFYSKYAAARKVAGLNTTKEELKSGFMRYLVEDVSLPGIDNDRTIRDIIDGEILQPQSVFESSRQPAVDLE